MPGLLGSAGQPLPCTQAPSPVKCPPGGNSAGLSGAASPPDAFSSDRAVSRHHGTPVKRVPRRPLTQSQRNRSVPTSGTHCACPKGTQSLSPCHSQPVSR